MCFFFFFLIIPSFVEKQKFWKRICVYNHFSIQFQLRRDRFIEEMESYTKQVEEFQTFGDMSEIQKYLRKAQALDNKLQAAAEKVLGFSLTPLRF